MSKSLRICSYYLLPFMFLAGNAFGFGTIKGTVVDGFGIPLEGVSVEMKDTEYKEVTDAKGFYKIKYTPGIANILYSKAGYTNNKVSLNVSEETDADHKPVTLWKYPQTGGLYLIRKNDYLLLGKNKFIGQNENNILTFILQGDPMIIPWGNLTILDYDDENTLVGGKNLFKVHDNNWLGVLGPSDYPIRTIRDRYIKVVNNVGIRIITLEPGKYFYCTAYLTNRTRMGEGYFFEIKPEDNNTKK